VIARGEDLKQISTYDEIAAKGQSVRRLLSDLRIALHRDSALSTLLRDADRIANDFMSAKKAQSALEVTRLAHANRVATAILAVGRDPGAQDCLRRMTGGTMDLSQRTTSAGKDALWEIELAEKFATLGLGVELTEPDIVLRVGGQPYPVACKKIYSERGVEAQMRKGAKQLERYGSPGLVAFNIDDLTPASSIFVSDNSRLAGDSLAMLNRSFVDRHRPVLERFVADGRCHGVLVTTNVVADLTLTAPRINNFSQTTVWTLSAPHDPKSNTFAAIVDRLQNPILERE